MEYLAEAGAESKYPQTHILSFSTHFCDDEDNSFV